jgi:excisionase family DNA binding protein
MEQLLFTIAQCCRMTAIGCSKFYQLIATGEIPVRKIGKKTLVAASGLHADLHAWIEKLPTSRQKAGVR